MRRARWLLLLVAGLAHGSAAAQTGEAPVRPDPSVLRASTATYRMMKGDSVVSTTAVTMARDSGLWVVTEQWGTGGRTSLARTRLRGGDLLPVTMWLSAGAVSADLKVERGKVTGDVRLPDRLGGARRMDVAVPLDMESPVGVNAVLAAMVLTPGRTITMPVFSLLAGGARVATFTVTGIDSVTVPAGQFETYRLEVTGEDAGTQWRRRLAPHLLVKQRFTNEPVVLELTSLR